MNSTARVIVLADADRGGKASLGMTLLLASWSVMFLALLGIYVVVRLQSGAWPPSGLPRLPLLIPWLATAVLAASSITMQQGLSMVRRARLHALPRWLMATLVLGAVFVLLQVAVCVQAWRMGIPLQGAYGSTFYVLTLFHALHVACALGLVGWVTAGALKRRYHARNFLMVMLVSRFWHFLGAAWGAIFLMVYLL